MRSIKKSCRSKDAKQRGQTTNQTRESIYDRDVHKSTWRRQTLRNLSQVRNTMRIKIYKTHPKKFNQHYPNYLELLRQLMKEMKHGEVAVIKIADWAKTAPTHMYQAYTVYNRGGYTFSGRNDEKYYYIKKVKYPIDRLNKKTNRYTRINEWAADKPTFKIVKIKQNTK